MNETRIAIIGMWHLGSVTAACLARAGYHVLALDANMRVIEGLSQGRAPLHEPGLDELLRDGIDAGRLRFSTEWSDVADAEFVWFTHDVPVDDNDEADTSCVIDAAQAIAKWAQAEIYMVSSQVPVGTCDTLAEILAIGSRARVVYIPENLQLGQAVARFEQPDVTVIGAPDDESARSVQQLMMPFHKAPIICDVRTAEMTKHAINAFLAVSISLANELGDVAAALGADAHVVAQAMRADRRIGEQARVIPGLPFAGGTLARDLRSLRRLGAHVKKPTMVCDAAMEVNSDRTARLVDTLASATELKGAHVGLLGLAYTDGTDTLRRSPGLDMAARLRERGAMVAAYDPQITVSAARGDVGAIRLCSSPYQAANRAAAVVVVRRGAVHEVDLGRLATVMDGDVVLDAWNFFKPEDLQRVALRQLVPGRPIGEVSL